MTTQGSLTLTGVTVVNTRNGELAPGMTVVVENGRIAKIIPDGSIPASAETIPATGKFLVPGYLDMHMHVLEDTHPRDAMDIMLAHGITGWRQMAGTPELLAQRSQGTLSVGPDTPELLEMPGQILTAANAATPEAAIAEIQRQQQQGADFIKTIFVSPKTFFAALEEARRLNLGYSGHISPGVAAEKAARSGMTSIEHLGGPVEMQLMACSARGRFVRFLLSLKPPAMPDLSPEKMATVGKLIIASPTLFRLRMDPKSLARTQKLLDAFNEDDCRKLAAACVEGHTWQTLTLIRVETMQLAYEPRFAEDPNLQYVPKAKRQFWNSVAADFAALVTTSGKKTLDQMMAVALRMTKIFDECGVGLLAGTDYGGMWVIPGVSLHQEFDLLERAGLSPLTILQMTTLRPAQFLNRESTMGTVEPGKDANLVLLDRNPVESAQNLHAIHAVIRADRLYSKESLDSLKRAVAARIAAEADPPLSSS